MAKEIAWNVKIPSDVYLLSKGYIHLKFEYAKAIVNYVWHIDSSLVLFKFWSSLFGVR